MSGGMVGGEGAKVMLAEQGLRAAPHGGQVQATSGAHQTTTLPGTWRRSFAPDRVAIPAPHRRASGIKSWRGLGNIDDPDVVGHPALQNLAQTADRHG